MYRLLIADDEPLERDTLESFVVQGGLPCSCVKVKNGKEALTAVLHPQEGERIDIAILDIQMPLLSGLEAATQIHAFDPTLPIVFLTAWGRFDFAQRAIRAGAVDYLVKPTERETLIAVLSRIIDRLGPREPADSGPFLPGGAGTIRRIRGEVIEAILAGEESAARVAAGELLSLFKAQATPIGTVQECLIAISGAVESKVLGSGHPSPQARNLSAAGDYLESFIAYGCATVRRERVDKYGNYLSGLCEYLSGHCGQPILLEDAARQLGINQYYFGRLFKEHTGLSFNEYLRKVRIETSKRLLLEGGSVSEVSHQVGFHDASYFRRVFRAACGVTPVEYKRLFRDGDSGPERDA